LSDAPPTISSWLLYMRLRGVGVGEGAPWSGVAVGGTTMVSHGVGVFVAVGVNVAV
jgi:hypothetical protein